MHIVYLKCAAKVLNFQRIEGNSGPKIYGRRSFTNTSEIMAVLKGINGELCGNEALSSVKLRGAADSGNNSLRCYYKESTVATSVKNAFSATLFGQNRHEHKLKVSISISQHNENITVLIISDNTVDSRRENVDTSSQNSLKSLFEAVWQGTRTQCALICINILVDDITNKERWKKHCHE